MPKWEGHLNLIAAKSRSSKETRELFVMLCAENPEENGFYVYIRDLRASIPVELNY